MPRYKGKDQIGIEYVEFPESAYGNFPSPPFTALRIGYPLEIVPPFDPEVNPVYVLRGESGVAGRPIALLSRRKNVRLRLTWLQPTMAAYWQTHAFAGKNFWMQAMIRKSDTDEFYILFTGLKYNVLRIRSSLGEPLTWIAEMIGKSMSIVDDMYSTYRQDEPTVDPWMWKDVFLQWRVSDGTYAVFPDLTDFEIIIDQRLKPNFIFNNSGSLELTSLEETETKVTARLTANLTNKDFLSYLLNQTNIDLQLNMPNSKQIELKYGKFKAVEPTIKPEDLIAQRLDYEALYFTSNF